jgi:hypothetical protein
MKKWKVASVGENIKKLEPSCIAGGNVKWYSMAAGSRACGSVVEYWLACVRSLFPSSALQHTHTHTHTHTQSTVLCKTLSWFLKKLSRQLGVVIQVLVISALRRWRQEDHEFEVSLGRVAQVVEHLPSKQETPNPMLTNAYQKRWQAGGAGGGWSTGEIVQ